MANFGTRVEDSLLDGGEEIGLKEMVATHIFGIQNNMGFSFTMADDDTKEKLMALEEVAVEKKAFRGRDNVDQITNRKTKFYLLLQTSNPPYSIQNQSLGGGSIKILTCFDIS